MMSQQEQQQGTKHVDEVETASTSPIISWPGYGILFFWQLGVLQYLEQHFDLSACTMVGSSAGSMLSVLAACNIKPQDALNLAHDLCLQQGVFERPLGLMGVWGGIVRSWLDTLLPLDAVQRCHGRVRIVITTLPQFQRQVVTSFKDREDLIDCCLASSHVPFLMDWNAAAVCRGRRCVDGSMLYILTGHCEGLRPLDKLKDLLLFDPWSDRELLRGWNVLRCVLLCGKQGAQHLLDQGFTYAKTLDNAGALMALEPLRQRVCKQEGGAGHDHQQDPGSHHVSDVEHMSPSHSSDSLLAGYESCLDLSLESGAPLPSAAMHEDVSLSFSSSPSSNSSCSLALSAADVVAVIGDSAQVAEKRSNA